MLTEQEKKLKDTGIAGLTVGDLAHACGYAEAKARQGGDNADTYAAVARTLSNVIETLTFELGDDLDEHIWILKREWERV